MVEADDPILFGLDRRHDVAHAVGPRRVDRRQQSRVHPVHRVVVSVRVRAGEDLVGEIHDIPPTRVELTASTHTLGVRGSSDVERAGCRGPPIEQQRLELVRLVEQSDTADVGRFPGDAVQPAEAQTVIRHVQPGDLPGQRPHSGVPLHQRAAVLGVDRASQRRAVPALHPRALGVESHIEPRHVCPLVPQFFFVVPVDTCPRFPVPGVTRSHADTAGMLLDLRIPAQSSDSAAHRGPCRKPPGAL